MRKNLGGEFEFTLHGWRELRRSLYAVGDERVGAVLWTVTLPHQCGPWAVAGGEDGSPDGVPKAEAMALLERFVAEAQVALEQLRALPDETSDGPHDDEG